jgi:hypothetical protein
VSCLTLCLTNPRQKPHWWCGDPHQGSSTTHRSIDGVRSAGSRRKGIFGIHSTRALVVLGCHLQLVVFVSVSPAWLMGHSGSWSVRGYLPRCTNVAPDDWCRCDVGMLLAAEEGVRSIMRRRKGEGRVYGVAAQEIARTCKRSGLARIRRTGPLPTQHPLQPMGIRRASRWTSASHRLLTLDECADRRAVLLKLSDSWRPCPGAGRPPAMMYIQCLGYLSVSLVDHPPREPCSPTGDVLDPGLVEECGLSRLGAGCPKCVQSMANLFYSSCRWSSADNFNCAPRGMEAEDQPLLWPLPDVHSRLGIRYLLARISAKRVHMWTLGENQRI